MDSLSVLEDFLNSHFNELKAIRRHLHANPELSHHEKQTSSFISNYLNNWNIEHKSGIAGFGIVGDLEGNGLFKEKIALRADIDALPIQEINEVDYCSLNEGVMHACGHDVHTTILMGSLWFLKSYPQFLKQPIRFIFQPAEEKVPSGAKSMIKAGVLNGITAIYGLHVTPELDVGKVGIFSGPFMASSDELHFDIQGIGGHAAQPDKFRNPIAAGAEIVTELEKLTNIEEDILVTIGYARAEGATNIVPKHMYLKGTLRTFSETNRSLTLDKITNIIAKIEDRRKLKILLTVPEGYPVLVNDEFLCRNKTSHCKELMGNNQVISIQKRMGSEDFAWYTQKIPGCFIRLGSGYRTDGNTTALHQPNFDVNEDCIKFGIKALLAGLLV